MVATFQMQNPNESLDMKGLLDQVQQSVGVSKMSMQSNGNSNKDKYAAVLCRWSDGWTKAFWTVPIEQNIWTKNQLTSILLNNDNWTNIFDNWTSHELNKWQI